MNFEKLQEILDEAVCAPSGDNSQPWHFSWDADELRIYLIPDRDNPLLNFRLSGTYIAHGALIENITLACQSRGYRATVALLPDVKDKHCTAAVTFTKEETPYDKLQEYIRARHTNRKHYNRAPLSEREIKTLQSSADHSQSITVSLATDRTTIQQIANASAQMERIALETPALRALFLESILWSKEGNERGESGLFIDTMEVPPPAKVAFKLLKKKLGATFLRSIGFPAAAQKINSTLYASSSALALVSMAKEDPREYLEAGRAFERLWLSATMLGLSCQPVTGILFLARRHRNNETDGLLKKHLPLIQQADGTIQDSFGMSKDTIPAMLLRIGHAPKASSRSHRKKAEIRKHHS